MMTRNWWNQLLNRRNNRAPRRFQAAQRRQTTQQPRHIEFLEDRLLLAAADALGSIEGTVFQDLSLDGQTVDDIVQSGVTVNLYLDGGNGTFESNNGVAAGDDTVVTIAGVANPATSDAQGEFSFEGLPAGTYFVEQQAPPAGMTAVNDVAQVVISDAEARGTTSLLVDDFVAPSPPQAIQATNGSPASSSLAVAGILGGTRDLFVEVGGAGTSSTVDLRANQISGFADLVSAFGTSGTGVLTWDGDSDATTLSVTDLPSTDLTSGGDALGIGLNIGAGRDNMVLNINVYTDLANFSTVSIPIPNTGGASVEPVLAEFATDFTDTGTGADFTNVRAISMTLDATAEVNSSIVVDVIRTIEPTRKTVEFANYTPMTLAGTLFFDQNDNSTLDGTEAALTTAPQVTLFRDTDGNGAFTNGTDQQVATMAATGGEYSFTGLQPGDYLVRVDSSNFAVGNPLEGYRSSGDAAAAPDPDNDIDGDDNGAPNMGAVFSGVVTLVNLDEPINDADTDSNTNTTVDFGFFGEVDIQITKTDNVDPVTAGSGANNLVYTVTAFNDGPLDATGVTVSDPLIANLPVGWVLSGVSGSNSTTFDVTTGIWTIGDLADQASETLTVTLTIGSTAATGDVTNTAAVASVNEADSNATNDTATEQTTIQRRVDLNVQKSDNVDPVTAGSGAGNLVYTVSVVNNGPSSASGVAITDPFLLAMPTGFNLDSATPSAGTSFDAGTGIWTVGDLDRFESRLLTLTLTVDGAAAAQTVTNVVNISSLNETDTDTSNNTASEETDVIREVDIRVQKSDNNDPITAGSGAGNLVYTISAANLGPSNASGVVISDPFLTALPTGFTLDSAVGTGGSTFDTNTGFWTIGDLDRTASATLTVTMTVADNAASGTITNTALLQAVNETDTVPGNNNDSENTTIIRNVDVGLTKSDNVDPVIAGSGAGNLVYTVTATNNGPSEATVIEIDDPFLTALPTGFTLVSGVGGGASTFNPTTGRWSIPALRSTASETLTVTLTVDATAAAGTVTNTVQVASLTETDTNAANDSASEDTTVGREVDLAVTKSDAADPVTAGSGAGNLDYTVTITNSGPSDASNVTVSDAFLISLPTGITLDSATGNGGTTFDNTTGIWTVGNLASGDSRTLNIELTAGATTAAGQVTNSVTIATVDETDTNPANNTAVETTDIVRSVDIAVDKSDSVDPVVAGSGTGNLTYTITADNNGPSQASGVTIDDPFLTALPTGFTLESTTPSVGTFDATTGIWNIGELANGVQETLTVVLTVAREAAAGTVTNTVTVDSVNETDRDLTNNTASEETTIARSVDIDVQKEANVTIVSAGSGAGNLEYTVTATNLGPSDATGVVISDALMTNLPTGFSLDSATGSSGTTFNSTTGLWTIGDLAMSESETLTLVLTVGAAALAGPVTNTAALDSVNQTDINATNDTDSEVTTVTGAVDLRVTKTDVGDPVTAGSSTGNLTYIVTTENIGGGVASGVEVTDTFLTHLPSGFTLVSADGSDNTTFDETTGVWSIGTLPGASNRTLTVTITVDGSASPGMVTNTAEITSIDQPDVDLTNNTASEETTVVRSSDLSLTKSDSNDPVIAGSGQNNLVYTVTLNNAGPSNATGVEVSDQLLTALPAGVTLESVIGSDGSTFDGTTGLWDIGDIAAGEDRTLTVTLTVTSAAAAGTLTNVADITNVNEPDPTPDNDSATEPTLINRSVDIGLTKEDSNDPVIAGSGTGNLTYSVVASNTGPSDATGVVVSDALLTTLPAGVTIESVTGNGGTTFDATTGLWTVGTLPSGEDRELTVVLTVASSVTANQLTNVVEVTSVTETDSDPSNDTATETTAIERRIDLDVTKEDIVDPVRSPGVIEYLITVTNHGPAVATNVQLSDTLSSLVNYQDAMVSQGTVTNASGVVSGDLGTIGVGDTVTMSLFVEANIPTGATVNNIVSVTADETDSDPTNNTSQASTVVQQGLSSISGVVYEDQNSNGIQDPGEPPIPNATVALSGVDNQGRDVFKSVKSDSGGRYAFNGLEPGTYSLFEIQPGIFLDGQDTNESGLPVDVRNDAFLNLQLGPQQQAQGLNFGEGEEDEDKRDFLASNQQVGQQVEPSLPLVVTGTGVLSGAVAVDVNSDGMLDAGDQGIPGATVTLSGIDTNGNTVLLTRTTNYDGTYTFTGLPAGNYNILQTQPPGFGDGPEQPGSLMADAVLDDLFQLIALPDGGSGSGFSFLEGPLGSHSRAGVVVPVIAGNRAQPAARPMLEWSTAENAETYDIWFSQVTDDGASLAYRNQSATGNSLQVPMNFTPGDYRLWVRGISEDGTPGAWSAASEIELISATRIELPRDRMIDSTPTFQLVDAEGADSYEVVVHNGAGQTVFSAANLTTPTVAVTTPLELGTYRVFARTNNGGVTGPWSEGVEFTIYGAPEITSPDLASTFAAPMLEWSDVGADEYEVWINDVTSGRGEFLMTDTSSSSALLLEEGLPEGKYLYWVRGRDADGNQTAWSKPRSFEVNDSTIVTSPTASSSSESPVIQWTAVPGATHYDVWLSDSNGLLARERSATGTSHQFSESLTDGNYRVWVRPMVGEMAGSWSTVQRFSVGGIATPSLAMSTTDTSDRRSEFQWNTVEGAERYELWVNHVGVTNRVIHERSLSGTRFEPTTNLAAGTYRIWVRAISASGVLSDWSQSAVLTVR